MASGVEQHCLHRLCRDGSLNEVKELFTEALRKESVERELATGWGDHGYTPLHEAVLRNDHILLEYLLQWAKNPDCRAKRGSTPLQLATRLQHLQCIDVLLLHQADPSPVFSLCEGFTTELRQACKDGNLKKATEVIRAMKGNMTQAIFIALLSKRYGWKGSTVLHIAALNGHAKVLDRLLGEGGDVNCLDGDGCTALHLAAQMGHGECTKVLLHHNVDITMTNIVERTAKQIALHRSNQRIVTLLQSEEIIKEVVTNGDNLTELLKFDADQLEPDCLNRALIAAIENDNHFNVGKLILKGADNIEDCLKRSKEDKKPHARAMLLLVKAAQEGNRNLVLKVFGESAPGLDTREFSDEGFQDVQKAVVGGEVSKLSREDVFELAHSTDKSLEDSVDTSSYCNDSPDLDVREFSNEGFGQVSTVVPIEIARQNHHVAVMEELVLRTDVNKEEGTVYWHGLRLLVLNVSWLRTIHWVKRLRLARNGFRELPDEMGTYLKQVVKLDLQHNDLSTIPRCILELPSLQELNLSHNKLVELPELPEWSSCLTVLDLSHNALSSMPLNAVAPAMTDLNICKNQFRHVPLCICSFTTLHTLDISDNPDILTLPAEMGRLANLSRLNLRGLRSLRDPPRNVQRDTRDCIRYLNSKLRDAKGFYRMKLMLVGLAKRGKTTLVARLQGRDCGDESTVGVDVSEWLYKPSRGEKAFHFSIWDFGGQEECYAVHQCFLSSRSLYLLLFNLNHGEKGVDELRPWLNNIALRAPNSRVIIVGTHLDEIADDERVQVDTVLQKVADLGNSYSHIVDIVEVIPVGLKNRIENIGILKVAIYNHAVSYKARGGQLIMGQKIPASYHALDKQLTVVQQEVRNGIREPIMHMEEFKTMVQRMDLADIQDDDELKTATLFLTNVGSLLHYDDRGHNLNELYLMDPRWLCNVMSKVVTIRNRFVCKGILQSRDIPLLFQDIEFPWQYYEQFVYLLDKFEIALPLDNTRILIPSMLPDIRQDRVVDSKQNWNGEPFYTRYIIFSTANTPPGFWSRLLSRIMHSVPQVTFALNKTTPKIYKETSPLRPGISLSLVPTIPSPTTIPDDLPESPMSPPVKTPMISAPISSSGPQPLIQAPQLLPNFPVSLPLAGISDTFDPQNIQLEFWQSGIFYSDPNVMFRIESLHGSSKTSVFYQGKKDGVLIVASPNNLGKKTVGQLVDLVVSLVNEWYPGLQEGAGPSSGLEQRVPCYECLKLGRPMPFEFPVEYCLSEILLAKQTTMDCRYETHDVAKNHTVSLVDIVPDLLLQDINPEFLLNPKDLVYTEDDASLLGRGGYGKVYRGKCHGKPVAIKKYLTRNEDAFTELRWEAKLLEKSHHPCVVNMVGVCTHPVNALVMEEAPMGSLEKPLIKEKTPIHRIVIHKIAAEVAAALRFLHGKGIIHRGIKANNVLLWSLAPESLCHCKVADFGIATHLSPVGAKGLIGTKGFIAPEVLYIGKRKQHSVYDHKADIFSFGMLLYQMIARRHPYHDIQPQRINTAVEQGERPKLQDVSQAESAFYYLTRLMKMCWADNPRERPSTDEIIKKLCLVPMQSVMCVHPVRSRFSLRHVCGITPSEFTLAGVQRNSSELWLCCNGPEGTEINIYSTNTMAKICKNFIKENQVQCICLCGDHVWVGSRAGIKCGVIDIFSVASRELVHNISMREYSVSCIACSDKTVYLGTLEGYCFSFCRDIKKIQANAKPRYKYISEHAVDGVVSTPQCVWVSHTRYIYFLNSDHLGLEGSFHCQQDAFIGQLSLSRDGNVVWSAHLGGVTLSAWDALDRVHKFDINIAKCLKVKMVSEQDCVITAMTPALDTVWVGTASGHILVFHEELLTWYHPYSEYVRFLSCVNCSGPCETEECKVVSGGKGFKAPVPDLEGMHVEMVLDKTWQSADEAGVMVLWEATSAKTTQQIKLIEHYADVQNHHSVGKMIHDGHFIDGTHITMSEHYPTSQKRLRSVSPLQLGYPPYSSPPLIEQSTPEEHIAMVPQETYDSKSSTSYHSDSNLSIEGSAPVSSQCEQMNGTTSAAVHDEADVYPSERFPGIHFLGNWQEPVTSEGAMIQWPDIGIEFTIPQRAVPAGKLLNLTVMPCLGGPFVLPNGYDIASLVYMVFPAFDFSEKVQLSMTHFVNPETDEDCEDMTFISAPSLPTFKDDIPEYHFKVLQKGTFHKNTRVGTIALRHFCALAVGRKRRQPASTMAPSAKKSCSDVVYSVQLHQASDQALFCVTICHPMYEKNLQKFLDKHYPDTSFHPSTKAPVVFSGSKVSLEILPGTTGWSIRKPCEISKAEVDLPLQCPDYASESLYYPPKMWLRLSPQTPPTQCQTSLKVCGLTEELEFSLESHLQCSRHSGVVAVPDRPKLPELISFPGREGRMNILQQIGTRYDQFGILILEDETGARLAAIIDRQHRDVIRINREIFQIWLQGSGRHPITWGTLVQCLWDAELNNLADEIAAIKLQQ